MLVLVDMDSVLADFEGCFVEKCRVRYPDFPFIEHQSRTTFYMADSYPKELRSKIYEIYHDPRFFHDMPPIPGAVEGVHAMAALGWDIFICTTPYYSNEHTFAGKYQWAVEHLGKGWGERVIFTRDKTVVHGDLLIDDKPDIKGVMTPTWEHIVFDQAYNRHIQDKRRINWQNWREVLLP